MPAVVTGLIACAGYALTLFPSVPGGDAGELIGAVATTGVPHPSGYPLYALLTKAFLWLPVMNVAWRANFAAAVMASAAAAAIAWGVADATGRRWAGIAAAAAFAFSPTVWLYAVSAEVFSLNNLLIAIELGLLVAVDRAARTRSQDRRPQMRLICAAALIFGLGLSNHATSLFFNGIIVTAMIWRTRDDAAWRTSRAWLTIVGCVALGGLPYLYLPLAAASHSLISWGEPDTLSGFLTHVLRREYGTFQLNANLAKSGMSTLQQLGYYVSDLNHQITGVGIALAAWGLVRAGLDGSTRFLAVTTALAWSVYLVVLHALATFPLDNPLMHGVVARFWQAPNLIVCVWLGWGIASLRLPARALAALAIVIAVGQPALHARAANHRRDVIVRDYGRAILESLPPRALVLMRGDLITNSARYLHYVEGVRPDVRLLDQELLTFRWTSTQVQRQMPDVVLPGTHYDLTLPGSYSLRALIDANIASRPVVICGGPKTGDSSLTGVYRLMPVGLCERVSPMAEAVDVAAWLQAAESARPRFENDMRVIPPTDSWEYVAWTDYWESFHDAGFTTLTLALERRDDQTLLRSAATAFDQLIADHPTPPAYAYKNLGIALSRLAPMDASTKARAVAAWETYLRIGPPDDRDRPAIDAAVRAWR